MSISFSNDQTMLEINFRHCSADSLSTKLRLDNNCYPTVVVEGVDSCGWWLE